MSNFKRGRRKIKTVNGYLPGDGPRGNSRKDQTKQQALNDQIARERIDEDLSEWMEVISPDPYFPDVFGYAIHYLDKVTDSR